MWVGQDLSKSVEQLLARNYNLVNAAHNNFMLVCVCLRQRLSWSVIISSDATDGHTKFWLLQHFLDVRIIQNLIIYSHQQAVVNSRCSDN